MKRNHLIAIVGRALAASLLVLPLVATSAANAVEFPDPGSPLYFQTSGRNAGLNIGDWYTNASGGDTDHVVLLPVPDGWPAGTPVTVAVYDPESYDGGSTGLSTNDEVRNAGDTTRFTLVDPGTGTLAQGTFPSIAATHGAWVEILTFLPIPGTVYELHSETGVAAANNRQRNDDNSWRLSFTSDPDCAVGQPVGTCTGIEDGDETDDPDSTLGTGDELAMGFQRASYQYTPGSTVTFWFYVDSSVDATVTLHNFDLDNNGGVTYHRADGTSVSGTVSGRTTWNGSTDSTRVGDVVPTNGSTGWWRADIRASNNNQFSFEVDGQVPVYFAQPPTPLLDITIDDSDLDIAEGEAHTYVITVDNVSDTTSAPGAAIDSVITVPLPAGSAFNGCTPPTGASCVESGGVVTFTFTDPIAAGATSVMSIDITGGPGLDNPFDMTANATYEDILGNQGAPVSATDSDIARYPDLSVTISPDTTTVPGTTVAFDVAVDNVGDHVQPGTQVVVPIPPGVSVDGDLTDPRWSCSGGDEAPVECVWSIGTMDPSDSGLAVLAFDIPAGVDPTFEGFSVGASISGDYVEIVTDNNADSASVTVEADPDPTISVTAPADYVPGLPADWLATASNIGDQDAVDVTVEVVVPVDADAAPALAEGWVCTPDNSTGSTCTFDVGELPAGFALDLPFLVDTAPSATDPVTLTASITDDGADADLTNNADEATITPIPLAELTIDVTVNSDPVNVGDPVEFAIVIGNEGPSTATAVEVVVDAPADVLGISIPIGCSISGPDQWTCSLGDIAPGETVTLSTSGITTDGSTTLGAEATSPEDADDASDEESAEANLPPVGTDLEGWAAATIPYVVDLLDLTSDPDGDTVSLVSVTPTSGEVSLDGSEFTYTPGPDDRGTVIFDVTITDELGLTDTFTVTIHTVPVRDVEGKVFVDVDKDGAHSDADTPLGGAIVTVHHDGVDSVFGTADDLFFSTISDADGSWEVQGVPEGTTKIESTPAGRSTRSVETTDDYILMAYEEVLPVTGIEVGDITAVSVAMILFGCTAILTTRRKGREA